MTGVKEKIIDRIILVEGGYVDDPDDSGGATNFGITEEVARAFGYEGDMRDLPREIAFEIYVGKYWSSISGDQLAFYSEAVAEEVADTAVNIGPNRAAKILQRSLNVLNNCAGIYPDISVDGAIGPATLDALYNYLLNRSPRVLLKVLNCLQGAFYIELAEARIKDEKFIYGWFKNRVEI